MHVYLSKLADPVEERLRTGPDLPYMYEGYSRLRAPSICLLISLLCCPKSSPQRSLLRLKLHLYATLRRLE
jgi:hypothetical protein